MKAQTAYQTILSKIKSGAFPPGSKLPSIRELCSTFKLSTWSILKAFEDLEKNGHIVRKERSGVYAKGEPILREEKSLKPRLDRADEIARAIEKEILIGNLRTGEYLPLQKTLQYQYRASAQTIRAALRICVRDDLIHRKGHNHVAGGESSHTRFKSKSVEVVRSRHTLSPFPMNQPNPVLFTAFEKEMSKHGVPIYDHSDRPKTTDEANLRKSGSMGSLLFVNKGWMNRAGSGELKKLEFTLARLVKNGRRLALFNSTWLKEEYPGLDFRKFKNVYPFGLDNLQGGKQIGMFITARGHKRVAYFGVLDQPWVHTRLQGLNAVLHQVWGEEGFASPYKADFKDRVWQGRQHYENPERRSIIESAILELFDGYVLQHVDPCEAVAHRMYELINHDTHRKCLFPLFDQAMKERSTTAWVCADATVATIAYYYLRERGIRVPEDLSLACIDDKPTTLVHGITSLSFQTERMGYLAAHAILQDIPVRKNDNGIVECPGVMVDRGSVGSVPG